MMEEFIDGLKTGPNGTIERKREEIEILARLKEKLKGNTKYKY